MITREEALALITTYSKTAIIDIIYADTLTRSSNWRHCSDDSRTLPSKNQALNSLANVISKQFVDKLAPKKINYSVVLMDDPIMDYTDKQDEQLKYELQVMMEIMQEYQMNGAAKGLDFVKEETKYIYEQLKKIEDTRTMKRNQVVDRAKQLLKGVMADMLPERKEISEVTAMTAH